MGGGGREGEDEVEDGGFQADFGLAAIEDQGDAAVEFGKNVGGGGGAGEAGAIGGRGGDGGG